MELKLVGTIVGGDGKTPIVAAQALSVMLYVHPKRSILAGDRSGVLRIYRKAITAAASSTVVAGGGGEGATAATPAVGAGAVGGAGGSGNGLSTNAIAEFKDHRGAILCIVQGSDPEIVFTGSADRSIKSRRVGTGLFFQKNERKGNSASKG